MINSLIFIRKKVNFVTRASVFQGRKLRVFLGILSLKFHMVMKGVARTLKSNNKSSGMGRQKYGS